MSTRGSQRRATRRRRGAVRQKAAALALGLSLGLGPGLAERAQANPLHPQAEAEAQTQPPSDAERAPVRRALLVGVENYPSIRKWKKLSGARTDVLAFKEALVQRAGFEPENVHSLLDEQATRSAILSGFKSLIDACQPGDVLVFYFAGHGSRLFDEDGDEVDGYDETLVPYDAESDAGAARDIRDDEIAELIELANQKTDQVVFIFDCCSAGTNVRGAAAGQSRFLDPETRGLAGARPGRVARNASAARERASGYFPPNLKYVSLSACRAWENAYEHRLEGQAEDASERVHGLFTYCLIRELNRLEGELSYAELIDRVRREVISIRPLQTPVVEGPMKRHALFDTGLSKRERVFEVSPSAAGAQISGGLLAGLEVGTTLDVVESGKGRPRRIGRLRLSQVRAHHSLAAWLGDPLPAAEGAVLRATVSARGRSSRPLGLALVVGEGIAPKHVARLAQAIEVSPELEAAPLESAKLVLTAERQNERARWVLSTPDGMRLPLEAALDSEAALQRLLAGIERLGSADRLTQSLRNESSNLLRIESSLERVGEHGKALGPPERDASGIPVLEVGEHIGCRLKNLSPFPIYASLLVISPDGSIYVMYQSPSEDDAIPPGGIVTTESHTVSMCTDSEPFYAMGMDRFRWVVSARFHDLSGLQQSSALEVGGTRGSAEQEAPVPEALEDEKALPINEWLTADFAVRTIRSEAAQGKEGRRPPAER